MVSHSASTKAATAPSTAPSTSNSSASGTTIQNPFVRQLGRLFVNRSSPVLLTTSDGRWFSRRRPLSSSELASAASGRSSLGVYSVAPDGTSRWAMIDLDRDEDVPKLLAVARTLDPRNTLVETSRRGIHVWVVHHPVPWVESHLFGRSLLQRAGIEKTEVNPKGPDLTAVRLPGSRHPKTGCVYPIIDPQTGEIVPLEEAVMALVPLPLPETGTLYRLEPPRPIRYTGPLTDHQELVQEVSKYVELKFYGPERATGRCPFHEDRHPSFGVLGGYFRCFANCLGEGRSSGGLNAFRARARERGLRDH